MVGVAAGALYLAGLALDHPGLQLAAKPVPVLALLLLVLSGPRDSYARLVAAGLAASALGDVILEGEGCERALWAVTGAVLFGLSDTLLALDTFWGEIPYVHYPIILLYWAGQIGIARSARAFPVA